MRILLLSALTPILLYCIAYLYASIKAKREERDKPKFFSNTFLNAFLLSLVIAIVVYLSVYVYNISKSEKNDYSSPAQKLQRQYQK